MGSIWDRLSNGDQIAVGSERTAPMCKCCQREEKKGVVKNICKECWLLLRTRESYRAALMLLNSRQYTKVREIVAMAALGKGDWDG